MLVILFMIEAVHKEWYVWTRYHQLQREVGEDAERFEKRNSVWQVFEKCRQSAKPFIIYKVNKVPIQEIVLVAMTTA